MTSIGQRFAGFHLNQPIKHGSCYGWRCYILKFTTLYSQFCETFKNLNLCAYMWMHNTGGKLSQPDSPFKTKTIRGESHLQNKHTFVVHWLQVFYEAIKLKIHLFCKTAWFRTCPTHVSLSAWRGSLFPLADKIPITTS